MYTVQKIKKYRTGIILGGVILIFLVIRGFLLKKPDTELTYIVTREALVDTIQVGGTYVTSSQTEVYSTAKGIITKLYVDNTREVKKGDPLFHVESTATDEEKAQASAAYLAAKATLDADTAKLYSLQSTMYAAWEKYTDLATNSTYEEDDGRPKTENRVLPEFTTTQDDWLAAEANFKNQQGVIAKDKSALTSTLLAYNATQSITINASANGTVANLRKKSGDQVTVSQPQNRAEPVLVITDLSNPYISAEISEDYAARVSTGQTVHIVFDSLKDMTFTGKIETVDTVGKVSYGMVTYGVRIAVNDISPLIKPNMTATLTIQTLRKDNVLIVPNSAIITRDGKAYVIKAHTKGKDFIEVTIGTKGITKTEITSGIKPDTIIVANPD